MNLKSVEGLKFLNVLLSNKVWSSNEDWLWENIFKDTDIDCFNHMINTEINGKSQFKKYEGLLQHPYIIEELTTIEKNIKG